MYKTIGVTFVGGGTYAKTYYYLTDDMTIEVNDYCLVIGSDGSPAVVKVNDAAAIDSLSKATKVIMQKIDTGAYYEKVKMIADREAKNKRLEEISKEVAKRQKYKGLLEHSEEAKQLMIDLGYTTEEEVKS